MALLYRQLCDAILSDIHSGRLKPGDPVASEFELARQFGVSRITSKRALDTLRQDGVVVRERGRGTFVACTAPVTRTNGPAPMTPRIGYVVPDMSATFGLRMFEAIEEAVRAHGYQLVLRRTQGLVDAESQAIAEFVATGITGLIVFPVHGEYYNAELLRHVIAGFPVVLVDRMMPGIPVSSVGTDNESAAQTLADHLINRGHTSLAFVSPIPNRTSSIEHRLRGFRVALGGGVSGLELTSLTSTLPATSHGSDLAEDEQRVLRFFERHPEISGVVACEFTLAQLIELVLTEVGLPVPEIVCFDTVQDPFDRYPFPHIRQNEQAIGATAVNLLLSQIEAPGPARNVFVDYKMVLATSGYGAIKSERTLSTASESVIA